MCNNNNQTATSKVNCPANRGNFLLVTRRLEEKFQLLIKLVSILINRDENHVLSVVFISRQILQHS